MNRIYTKTICLLAMLAVFASAEAQTRKFNITGSVKDSAKSMLSFATVSLFRSSQPDQPVKSTYTTEKGTFRFNEVEAGNYSVIVSFTGYRDSKHELELNDHKDLGVIEIAPAAGNLQGVIITSRKPLIEQADDKVTFNVENDPASKTESAIEILRKTPFVTVDGDDNIQVNGQSNFKVLLNGRETAMFAQNVKEALKGFPGSAIVKIEVITSPGAKYDAEGVGGIINIITKKKLKGYNGSVSANASSNRWGNGNANLSAKFGNTGVTVHYGGGGNFNMRGKSRTETTPLLPSLFTRRVLDGDRRHSSFWNFGNAELSFEIDSLNTLSAYGNLSGGWHEFRLDQTVVTEYPSAPATTGYYDNNSRNEYPTRAIGTDYIRKFAGKPDREFSIRLNAEFSNANHFSNSLQDNPASDRYVLNRSVADNRQYTFQSDYIHPFKNNQRIEGGVKAILRRASSDFISKVKYSLGEDFKTNPGNSDVFGYQQDVFSAYGTYSFKLKKTTFRLGLRAEHTIVDGDFTTTSTKVKQEYTSILPNVQASLKLNTATSLVFNYGQRIQRPYIWNLNPFVNNNDSLFISYGNPALDPQTIHTVSAQARVSKGGNFAGITLSASYSDDMIVQYATFNPATGVTSTTNANLGKELQLNLNTNLTLKAGSDFTFSLNGNLRYNRVQNKSLAGQVNSGIGGNANMNINYTVNKRFNLSSYAGFWRAPVSLQYRYPLNHWYGINMGYKMFNEKLRVSLGVNAFLKKNWDYRMVINDPNFRTVTTSTFPFRGVGLGFTWNFGKLKENVSKKKGVTNDDLIGGGQSN